YGALGDGTTDDTAAIQAAINAATGAANPATTTRVPTGIVYLPPGNYKVTADLYIRSVLGFIFRGSGIGQTIIYASGSGFTNAVLSINGSSDSIFEQFEIRGLGGEQVNAGIRLDWVNSSRSDPGCITTNASAVVT